MKVTSHFLKNHQLQNIFLKKLNRYNLGEKKLKKPLFKKVRNKCLRLDSKTSLLMLTIRYLKIKPNYMKILIQMQSHNLVSPSIQEGWKKTRYWSLYQTRQNPVVLNRINIKLMNLSLVGPFFNNLHRPFKRRKVQLSKEL